MFAAKNMYLRNKRKETILFFFFETSKLQTSLCFLGVLCGVLCGVLWACYGRAMGVLCGVQWAFNGRAMGMACGVLCSAHRPHRNMAPRLGPHDFPSTCTYTQISSVGIFFMQGEACSATLGDNMHTRERATSLTNRNTPCSAN